MTSVMKLAEVVDVVIGVDTHVATHAAAAVDARTGGVLAQITVSADAEGYEELVDFADTVAQEHGALRAWAIEGTAPPRPGGGRSTCARARSWASSWTDPNESSGATGRSPTQQTRSVPPARH